MKNLLILATMLLTFGFSNAQSKIYLGTASYNSQQVGYLDGIKVYQGTASYNSKQIGYIDGGRATSSGAALLLLF